MTIVELRVPVDAVDFLGEPASVCATITLPDADRLPARPVVCFAKSAGAYGRGYFTHALPGPGGEAGQAQWHARAGWIFVAIDHAGTGDGSRHAPERLNLPAVAEVAHLAEQEILIRLANGLVAPGYPPVIQPTRIGLGHSFGGCVTIMQQAHYGDYEGIVVLGYGVLHNHPASPPGQPPIAVPWASRDIPFDKPGGILNRAAIERDKQSGAGQANWDAIRWSTYFDDVPDAVVEADLAHYAQPEATRPAGAQARAPWAASGTAGQAVRSVLTPGIVAPEAAAVGVPVLIGLGQRDTVPDPAGEPRAYRSASSIDLFICPRMGHAHNFASTRALLWERIGAFGQWCDTLAGREGG